MNGSTVDFLIVGAGASGMMAAITAAEQGASVAVLEKNGRPGRKLYITGKGRCNVTNDSDAQTCLAQTRTNPKFLYAAMQAFPPSSTIAFFEALGCPLKTERGNRVFPCSDHAADVIDALNNRMRELRIGFFTGAAERLLIENGTLCGVHASRGDFRADRVLLATGGASYPRTGSTGDGYALARQAGHTIIEPTGSLVPLLCDAPICRAGLALKNVELTLQNESGKTVYAERGELTLTDYGLDGPMALTASTYLGRETGFTAYLDLKPALDEAALDARILRDLKQYQNSPMEAALTSLLPRALIVPVLRAAQIAPTLAANSLTRDGRKRLVQSLKRIALPIQGKRPIEEAIVTAGGVDVREVNPRTMESKLLPGLYFAGELLDLDARTGGFNLQIAWATGHAAGLAAAMQGGSK